MAVAFEEMEGSPTVSIGPGGTQAKRIFRVAWNDWQDFAEELTGGWRRVSGAYQLREPLPFPGLPNVVVDSLQVAPFDARNPAGSHVSTLTRGLNEYPSAGALVTVQYKSRPDLETEDDGDKPEIIPGTILTYRSDLGAESVTIPGRAWNWNVAGDPKVPDDVNPGILMPTGSYTLHWDRVARPPWSAIRTLRGRVNDAPFYGAGAGTVLFLGARANRKFEFLRNATLWSIEYAFTERSEPWNRFFRLETNAWTEIEDRGGNPPYAAGDFTDLFRFGT